jgi:hypothetical protein
VIHRNSPPDRQRWQSDSIDCHCQKVADLSESRRVYGGVCWLSRPFSGAYGQDLESHIKVLSETLISLRGLKRKISNTRTHKKQQKTV